MKSYQYKPVRFYIQCFTATWFFWISSICLNDSYKNLSLVLLLLGLFSPPIITIITIFSSKNLELKNDFKNKFKVSRVSIFNISLAIATFFIIVVFSILVSFFFGQPMSQLSFSKDFTFSIGGVSALLTILLASTIEEIGWRGYGEDAIAKYLNWFDESILFGIIWSLWHLPLFWVEGTYHFMLKDLGMLYSLNFLVSVVPLGFLTTWVYVKNNRSIVATIIFHIFVNLMQERLNLTPQTKCIETIVIILFAILIIMVNKDMFSKKLEFN